MKVEVSKTIAISALVTVVLLIPILISLPVSEALSSLLYILLLFLFLLFVTRGIATYIRSVAKQQAITYKSAAQKVTGPFYKLFRPLGGWDEHTNRTKE